MLLLNGGRSLQHRTASRLHSGEMQCQRDLVVIDEGFVEYSQARLSYNLGSFILLLHLVDAVQAIVVSGYLLVAHAFIMVYASFTSWFTRIPAFLPSFHCAQG